uniref:EF-hand calcium binding domain 14 n=1 Tax=Nothobranchius furzeri TaxID=105023 RepID=A0A8C6VX24_NOTFU
MKKRKELNALIGLGDSKRKKTKKGSGHRLLRTEPPDSESESSSEDDDFNNPNSGANFGKKSYWQCCNVCYPLFLFIILAACVMACAGLIWMQIALKEDLDSLQEKLHSMESSQKVSSSEIPKISEDLKNKDRKLDDIKNGDKGLSKLWFNLTEMNRKITLLDSAVNHLKVNLKSAADLISLPTTVEELQKSVATIGSTLTSVQHDVKTMQDSLENQKKEDDSKKTTNINDLKKVMSEVNETEEQHHVWTDEQIHILLSTVADLHQRVASLENGSKHSVSNRSFCPYFRSTWLWELSTVKKLSSKNKINVFLKRVYIFCKLRVLFLFILDLEDFFTQAGIGKNSLGVTYQDLKRLFGTSTPSERALECFDSDGDQRYSLMELRAAVGL